MVTARKREERNQDVPGSIGVVTATDIRDGGIDSVGQASFYVPNTLVTGFTARRLSFPFVRGVGSGQGDPAVATFIDGIPQLTYSNANPTLLDVEQIEFLRGPNSTLYGRNTIGGAINIVTRYPSSTPEAQARVTLGNYGRQDYQLSYSAPLGDDVGFSIAGLHFEREGFTTNTVTGNDIDSRDTWAGRAQVVWAPSERDELRLVIGGERSRDGGFALSELQGLRVRPNEITQDFEGETGRDVFSSGLIWKHVGDASDFTSITSVNDWSIDESADFDFSQLDGVRRFTTAEQTYVYQEFRLASPADGDVELWEDGRLRWLVGASGFLSDTSESAANEFRPGGAGIIFPPAQVGTDRATGEFDDYAFAVFGQATVEISEHWELSAGLRYDRETKDANLNRQFETGGQAFPTSSSNPKETYDEVLPRASLAYRPDEDVTVYVLAARGFKAGGFNLTAPTGSEAFSPETSWSYEAGVKTSWLDRRLEANASVFHVDWSDMQLSQFDVASGGFVTNAGDATVRGVEFELRGHPTEWLMLFTALGFLDSEFDRFVDQFGQDVSGNALPFAPDMTANAGAQLTANVTKDTEAFARAEYFHIGEFFYDAGNLSSESFELVNLRAGFGGGWWRVDGFIENLLDENYVPIAFQANPADPTMFVGESAAPRTFGVTVRVTF